LHKRFCENVLENAGKRRPHNFSFLRGICDEFWKK